MRGDITGEHLKAYRERPDWREHYTASLKKRTYPPRSCDACGVEFIPAGGRGRFCDEHVSSVTAKRRQRRQRFKPSGTPHTEADFWARVRKTDSCWLWEGPARSDGRGLACLDGVREHAHRVAWRLLKDPFIQDGVGLYINCGNRACVNPAHMRLVDEAYKRKVARYYLLNRETQEQVAERFNVDRSSLSRWVKRYGLSLNQEA